MTEFVLWFVGFWVVYGIYRITASLRGIEIRLGEIRQAIDQHRVEVDESNTAFRELWRHGLGTRQSDDETD